MCSNREEEIDTLDYDSKSVAGFVGLAKQIWERKAYLNSLLQVLFHLPCFRRAVYQIPENVNAASIVSLKTLFRKLEDSDTSVSMVLKLSGSNLKLEVPTLCQEIEDAIKGTVGEGTIRKLFEGRFVDYKECRNVDDGNYPGKESFLSLDLEVINCKDVYASFDKFVEKQQFFTELPPILQLQFVRFHYDRNQDTTVKLNARYEYPLELDLDRDNRKYLSTDADRSTRNLYTLHRLKFEDEIVVKADAQDVQFGHHENAKMFIYVRESEKAAFSQRITFATSICAMCPTRDGGLLDIEDFPKSRK